MQYYTLVGAALRALPAETAHNMAISALKHGLVPGIKAVKNDKLTVRLWEMEFENPVGLAAGFDKNAEAVDGLLSQGFGYIELGTVTPLPQPGNPRPRIFRLVEDEAVINRFGFNSLGIHQFARNLEKRSKSGIVGANIGKNKDSLDAVYDYSAALQAVYPLVDYVTVNISSPNTVGLRDLQQKESLEQLVQAVEEIREQLCAGKKRKPLLYKIAPDLNQSALEDIVTIALAHKIDGLIISNTTILRPDSLSSSSKAEKGGLSGKPLLQLSTQRLGDVYRISQGKIPLIGAGGIASAADAYEKIKSGASLLQLYTALVYRGFEVIKEINNGLIQLLEQDGFKNIQEAVGSAVR